MTGHHSGFTALDDLVNSLGHALLLEEKLGLPTGALWQSFDRYSLPQTSVANVASGTLFLVPCVFVKGKTVTSATFVTGSTAFVSGGTPHQWFSLWDSALGKLAVSSDDTSTAWGATTSKTLSFAAGSGGSGIYTPTYTGRGYVGCVVVTSGTMPNFLGLNISTTVLTGIAPKQLGSSSTALTDPASAPSTAGAITQLGVKPYCYLS